MSGRARAGDGVVDHLTREHERRHDGHGRELFGGGLQALLFFFSEFCNGYAHSGGRGCVHRSGDRRCKQSICHMHKRASFRYVFVYPRSLYEPPGTRTSPLGGCFFIVFSQIYAALRKRAVCKNADCSLLRSCGGNYFSSWFALYRNVTVCARAHPFLNMEKHRKRLAKS